VEMHLINMVTQMNFISLREDNKREPANNIMTFIENRLPDDIKLYIYKEYLEPEVYYLYLERIFRSERMHWQHPDSYNEGYEMMLRFLPQLLVKSRFIPYISRRLNDNYHYNHLEKIVNEEHGNRRKAYQRMKRGESMATSLIMTMWH
jgi:hypothetical protein